ncbi:MAG TPA: hypothetical protein VKQ30_08300 [Ktedonobacterales bacterium]|nr:hypothetical protein [Ktedonobacterales bacterium]
MNRHLLYSMVIKWSDRVMGGPAVTHDASYEEAVNRGYEAHDALIAPARLYHEPLPQPRLYAHV